jgi:hypothetical protein
LTPTEIHTWLEENEPPFVLKTIGGRSYKIPDRPNLWIPDAYPEMLCLAVIGKGIVVLKISTIESVHIEHEMASAR